MNTLGRQCCYASPCHAHASQPHLSHSFSQPFISRISNSADHLVSTSLNQLNKSTTNQQAQPLVEDATLPFHEQVKNSAAYKLQQKNSVTVCSDSDVNVIGTAVRIQVRPLRNVFVVHYSLL